MTADDLVMQGARVYEHILLSEKLELELNVTRFSDNAFTCNFYWNIANLVQIWLCR